MNEGIKIISRNRKASHEYHLEEIFRAGIVLTGAEIKAIRRNQISLGEGYVEERGGEAWLMGVQITPYEQAGAYGRVDPLRPRKLLLHKKEIARISAYVRNRGYTCVPTMVFLERGRAKVEIALAKGKKLYDRRADIAKRDTDREIRRTLKEGVRE